MQPPLPAAAAISKVPIPELFELHSVFGEGREGRWEVVQSIFKEHIEPKLLTRLPESKSLKTRLLYTKSEAVGVLIYRAAEEDPLKRNLGRCLGIKVIHVNEGHPTGVKFLMDHLLKMAEEHNVKTLYAALPPASPLCLLLEHHEFTILHKQEAECLFIRTIGRESKDSRKRTSPKPEGHLDKKNRPERVPDAQPNNGYPKVMSSKLLIEAKEKEGKVRKEAKDCSIKMQYLKLIQNGSKTVEGRINNGIFARLREGQYLRFFCQNQEAFCEITRIDRYSSFSEMLSSVGFKPCLPDIATHQAAVDVYNRIPGYADKARQYGVLAIHIKRVPF